MTKESDYTKLTEIINSWNNSTDSTASGNLSKLLKRAEVLYKPKRGLKSIHDALNIQLNGLKIAKEFLQKQGADITLAESQIADIEAKIKENGYKFVKKNRKKKVVKTAASKAAKTAAKESVPTPSPAPTPKPSDIRL